MVRIAHADWQPFRIPLRQPLATAHTVWHAREGVIVRLTTADGRVGVGEASAVPGFGGSQSAILTALRETIPRLAGRALADLDAEGGRDVPDSPSRAAVACALDTALLDLRAQDAGVPLTRLLGGDPVRPVPVNTTVGAVATAEAVRLAQEAVAAGFRCLKLKVGVVETEEAEIDRILAVRAAIGPETALRIDANGAWEPEQAVRVLRALESAEIAYIEQPVAAADLAGMARVRARVRTLIAADEAVGGMAQARRLIAAGAADILVLKPMLAGGLRAARAIADLARESGLGTVVTTTLDTGIGTAAALHLAASLPDPLPACGLATAGLLMDDLITPALPVTAGTMRIPGRPGLGVCLDPA